MARKFNPARSSGRAGACVSYTLDADGNRANERTISKGTSAVPRVSNPRTIAPVEYRQTKTDIINERLMRLSHLTRLEND